MPTDVTFYTTENCHLCEQAEQLLTSVLPPDRIHKVDVADDDALIAQYGERIPVVRSGNNELDWPFSLLDLHQMVS